MVSSDYFPVFNQPPVSLETGPISKVTERGIKIDGGAGDGIRPHCVRDRLPVSRVHAPDDDDEAEQPVHAAI
jgi:hypothetical protein